MELLLGKTMKIFISGTYPSSKDPGGKFWFQLQIFKFWVWLDSVKALEPLFDLQEAEGKTSNMAPKPTFQSRKRLENCKCLSVCQSVSLSVCLSQKPLSLSESLLSTIKPIYHWTYRQSSLVTIRPIDHWAYQASSLSTIEPIDHRAYRTSSLPPIEPIAHRAYQPSSLSTIEPINYRAHRPSSLLTIRPILSTIEPIGHQAYLP